MLEKIIIITIRKRIKVELCLLGGGGSENNNGEFEIIIYNTIQTRILL